MNEADKYCRLCSKLMEHTVSKNLFHRSSWKVLRQVEEITGAKLKNTKTLPTFYCKSCETDLDHACQFRERVLKAQKLFHSGKFEEENYLNNIEIIEIKPELIETQRIVEPPPNDTETVFLQQYEGEHLLLEEDKFNDEEHKLLDEDIFNDEEEFEFPLKEKTDISTSDGDQFVDAIDSISFKQENHTEGRTNRKRTSKISNIHDDELKLPFKEKTDLLTSADEQRNNTLSDSIFFEQENQTKRRSTRKKNSQISYTNDDKSEFKTDISMSEDEQSYCISSDSDSTSLEQEGQTKKGTKFNNKSKSCKIEKKERNEERDCTMSDSNSISVEQEGQTKKETENIKPSNSCTTEKKQRRKRKKKDPQICELCGASYTQNKEFIMHLRRHAGDKQYQCEICNAKYYTIYELRRHMRFHTGERPFPCGYCEKSFIDNDTRKRHERVHANIRPYSCNRCDKSFSHSCVLRNHMLSHTGIRSFHCKICELDFLRQTHLARHNRSKRHNQNVIKKELEESVKQMGTDSSEKGKIEMKSGDEQRDCTLSDNDSTSVVQEGQTKEETKSKKPSNSCTTEKKEKRTRKKSEPQMCEQCGASFKQNKEFIMHMRRHAGDKRYQCEICSVKYYTSYELRRHMRFHTGERPFPCSYCEKRFIDRNTRKRHERVHANERPYSCNRCDKSFSHSSVLTNHMLSHSGVRSFHCKICDKDFLRRTHLVTHNRCKKHKQNVLKKELEESVKQMETDSSEKGKIEMKFEDK